MGCKEEFSLSVTSCPFLALVSLKPLAAFARTGFCIRTFREKRLAADFTGAPGSLRRIENFPRRRGIVLGALRDFVHPLPKSDGRDPRAIFGVEAVKINCWIHFRLGLSWQRFFRIRR